jgi:nuclease-like protein
VRRSAIRTITLAVLMTYSVWNVALGDDLIGQASVIDGDTLQIHGTRIRLWGIDAPESSQLCRDDDSKVYRSEAQAANDLDAFIARRPVNCEPLNLNRNGRTVARCEVVGVDLAAWLVRGGLALDCRSIPRVGTTWISGRRKSWHGYVEGQLRRTLPLSSLHPSERHTKRLF